MTKTLFIRTYGCQMNAYDSARMADVLAPLGYACVEAPQDADLVIINTCHIREHASDKVYSELGRLKALKSARAALGQSMLIAVAGCVAQAEGQEIVRRAPFVDLVVGPQAYHRLPEMVARASREGGHVLDTDFPVEPKFDSLPAASTAGPSAFLSIQEGCDKFCTFCVVPYTRGAEYSRPVAAILDEARRLVDLGALEITLLGQNVNAYAGPGLRAGTWDLARLIECLADIPGLRRLRYTTSHPRDMSDTLIAAHRDIPVLMPFLHLPVQSGADRILAAMNRQHSAADYLRIIDRLRDAQPAIGLSSDFIVGFPGETDADFAATLSLIDAVGFAQAYSFKYSGRPGTPAATLPDQVPESVKDERLKILQGRLEAHARTFNATFEGHMVEVLLDRSGRHAGQLLGRTPHMQSVFVAAPDHLLNSIQRLTVVATHANSLEGRLAEERACA